MLRRPSRSTASDALWRSSFSPPQRSWAASAGSLLAICGPFTDLAADGFCPFVLEIFYLGITTGTTATTYDPASNVSRLQMAAFLSRTVDGVLQRGGRRAALGQFWTPQNVGVLGLTTVGATPQLLASDGADVWSANLGGTVSRVRASDGRLLETWTGAGSANGIVVAMGRVFVTKNNNPGALYLIDPHSPPAPLRRSRPTSTASRPASRSTARASGRPTPARSRS